MTNRLVRIGLCVAAALTVAIPAAACTADDAAPVADNCDHVDAPMLDVPFADDEPRIRIPAPAGWAMTPNWGSTTRYSDLRCRLRAAASTSADATGYSSW